MSKKIRDYIISILGGVFYAIGINIFITPCGLYSGTLTGIAQMINTIITDILHIGLPDGFNLTGILLAIINLPLLILSVKVISRTFFMKTIFTVFFQSLAMSVISIPSQPVVDDILVACILGGLIAGFGAGITLRAGGSGGGTDIIGIYCIKKYPGSSISVGTISQIIGAFVYCFCLFMYDLNVVIYSAIFTVVYSFVIDRVHYQNIKTSVIIFSKGKNIEKYIVNDLERGATSWNGYGTYTNEPTNICMTVMSKQEAKFMRKELHKIDPNAFIVYNDGLDVSGNYTNLI